MQCTFKLARLTLAASVLALPALSLGCGGDDSAGPTQQAAPDLRSNLEATTKAADENAKAPAAPAAKDTP